MRSSTNQYKGAILWNGYDYKKQYWVFKGKKDTRTLRELRRAIKKTRRLKSLQAKTK